ncbi:MAG: methyltransferase domain-containing protein [Candidatus Acidiferrales bacterium]
MNKSLRREFDSVDRTTDPNDFVRYLDTTRATDFFQQIKQRTLALMDLHAGESAADVGCGTGEDVRALAARVSPGGRTVGVDRSSTMIAMARQRTGASKSSVEFVQADAQKLPFEDGCFDAIRAERLLQHTPDADAALGEIVRVAKRGGRIVIWEGDLDLFIIDAQDYDASRIMQRFICDSFRNGHIGHRLYKRFLDCGLADVQSIPLIGQFTDLALIESAFDLGACVERAIGQKLLQAERAALWLESLRSADRAGQFFSAIGGFIAFGRKN